MGEGERRSERKPQDMAIIEFIDQTVERERGREERKSDKNSEHAVS